MKKYIKVTATFDCDGNLLPELIYWDDGRKYPIDKIIDKYIYKNIKLDYL